MASSGSFSGSIRDGHYKLRVDWSQSKNVSANTSTVTCKLYLVNDWSLNISGRSDNTCTIDGSAQTFSSPAISSTGTHLLGTVSRAVNHASDGSKSLAISAVFQIRATLSGTYYGTITASANITLDSIPRASSVSAGNMTMGTAGKINISRASSSFTHTLTYSFGNTSGTIATKTTATSVSWTASLSLANQIPNATSGTCTITCTTYNGNTNIGSKTCTLSLSVPASVKPTISSLTASRIDGDVPSAWGIYVQTKSKVKLTINGAAGSYGSTIKSYSITGGGYSGSASTLTTGFLNNSGTITFQATVTDSRGRVSAEATVSITVTAYSPPYFNSSLSQRCLSNGTLDDDGTYIHALVSFGYSTCGGKNTLKTSVQYKQVSAEQWTDAGVTFASNAFEFSPWNEILGYELFVPNINSFGADKLLAVIIYEMTFCGFTEEDHQKEVQKLREAIAETESIQNLPEEERKKYYKDAEDVFAEFGYKDTRTDEEKQREREQLYRETFINHTRKYSILREYLKGL